MREYELVRSKRKTMSIQINREGKLVVRAPLRVAQKNIDEFVKSHDVWIEKHTTRIIQVVENRQSFTFSDNQSLYFLGEKLEICTSSFTRQIEVIENKLNVPEKIAEENREIEVKRFLSKQAQLYLPKRVASFAAKMGAMPQAITITSAKTRWGSCSGKNRISFSYRLICLPPSLIDYVVVHELAHIFEHNHSAKFYEQIEKILPNYKILQTEMKAFGKLLPF